MLVVTEVVSPEHVGIVSDKVEILQIARATCRISTS
jgi:3-deoxy-D-arabino-heptulosonate 7-phosphate (DAHP) synthase